ncbi:unnamed protein product [Penicillium roqueforti FM164]|uniref:Uncharacterized protein n=1 Tax=Penicillium roqueforti (strain FM164) TaxID=1365484 RepID=W6QII7_PENRF|nr:unnamed protein product [Penicillium roqueforti FM164]
MGQYRMYQFLCFIMFAELLLFSLLASPLPAGLS